MAQVKSKLKIRKGDMVVVIAGKDKGKSGKVLSINKKTPAALVDFAIRNGREL